MTFIHNPGRNTFSNSTLFRKMTTLQMVNGHTRHHQSTVLSVKYSVSRFLLHACLALLLFFLLHFSYQSPVSPFLLCPRLFSVGVWIVNVSLGPCRFIPCSCLSVSDLSGIWVSCLVNVISPRFLFFTPRHTLSSWHDKAAWMSTVLTIVSMKTGDQPSWRWN